MNKEVSEMLTDAPARPTIAVSDMDKAKAFYGDALGLKHVEDNPGGSRYEAGGTYIELYPSEFAGTAKNTVAGFEVSDLDATMDSLRQKGVAFLDYDLPGVKTNNGVADLGDARGCWFKDPDGNILAIIQLPT
jgi:catechol 2,3-dioxygenase-like lactoylglutathione lyase family enzyme